MQRSRTQIREYYLGGDVRDVAVLVGPDGRPRLVGADRTSSDVGLSAPIDDVLPTRLTVPVGKVPSIATPVSSDTLLIPDLRGTSAALIDLGMGQFGRARHVETDRGPSDGVAIDCLGDERAEILVAHKYSDSLRVFEMGEDGAPGLVADFEVGALFRLDGADLDADGNLEGVGLSAYDGSIRVFSFGEGCEPRLVQEIKPGVLSSDFVITDFDGDGDADILVSDLRESKVTVLLNIRGRLVADTIEVGAPSWSLAVGDFDADGSEDLVVADPEGKTIEVLLGGSNGRPRARVVRVTRNAAELVAVADLDGDGEDEILALDRDGGIELFDGLGGKFAELGTLDQPGKFSWVALRDLDRDGTPDLVVSDLAAKGVAFEGIQCQP